MRPRPPTSTLFPYTTLFRSVAYPIRYTRAFDIRPLTVAAAANVAPGGTVVGYPGLRLSYDFYLQDRKSTRLNSSHQIISYAVFCLKKKNKHKQTGADEHAKL